MSLSAEGGVGGKQTREALLRDEPEAQHDSVRVSLLSAGSACGGSPGTERRGADSLVVD